MLTLLAASHSIAEAGLAVVTAVVHLLTVAVPAGWENGQKVEPETVATKVRTFLGPLLLLAISVFALKFLAQRRMTQFFQFIGLAVLIAVLFYGNTIIKNVATTVGGWI